MPAPHTLYSCHCGKQFRQAAGLSRHKRIAHTQNTNTLQCHCGETFNRLENLKRHQKLHGSPEFHCDQCDQAFYRKNKLVSHQRSHINQAGAGPSKDPQSSTDSKMATEENQEASSTPKNDPPPSETSSEDEECDFENEALDGTLKTVEVKINGLAKFDPLRLFKEKEAKIKSILLKQLKKKGGIKWYASIKVQFKKEKKESTEIAQPHFRGHCHIAMKPIDLNEPWQETVKKIYDSFIKYQREGSAWILDHIISFKVHMVQWKPIRGSSYIPTPLKLRSKKAIINVQNTDKRCFMWAVLSCLYPKQKDPQRVRKYKQLTDKINMDGITYPVKLTDIPTFERNNQISINVFGYEKEVFPLCITKQRRDKHANLLLLSNKNTSHFCWIKDMSRLLSHTTAHNGRRFFCDYCLHGFKRNDLLQTHMNQCQMYGPQKIEMPSEDDKWLYFKDVAKQLKAPWIVYADFEAVTEKIQGCQPNPNKSNTEKMTKHVPSGFAYKVVGPTEELTKPTVVYSGDDVTDTFIEHMVKVQDKIDLWYKNPKPIDMKPEDWKTFNEAINCHICHEYLGDDRVRDHDHVTGRFRGAAHNECNINFRFRGKIPVVFHNLKNYDAHLIMKSIGQYQHGKLKVIANNMEKYISFSMGSMDFIDSFQFLGTSLEKLTNNLAQEGQAKFKHLTKEYPERERTDMLLRKGVFPYSWFDDIEKFNLSELPPQQEFYNDLIDEALSDVDYEHARAVWKMFDMKNFQEYHDLYLKTDVLLLADIFENFRNLSMELYDLDPAHYYTAPGLSWNAALKYTGVELELFTDPNMHLFIESGLRGGISMISHRFAQANNPYLPNYNPTEPKSYISYIDANNLYGWAMSKPLPTHGFRWLSDTEIRSLKINDVSEDSDDGYILEVDMEYPESLHDSHSDYPLAPESKIIKGSEISPFCKDLADNLHLNLSGNSPKLTPNLNNKNNYVLHYTNLQQYLKYGLKLTKVHRVMTFKQSCWLKPYIDLNTERRKLAKNAFEKDFFKLMNNSVFGKTMENLRKRRDIELVHKALRMKKLACKPSFHAFSIFTDDLAAVEKVKTKLFLNRPIYCGFTILDVSKTLMYSYHYDHILPTYGSKATLLFTDTDSLCYHITTEDVYADMAKNIDLYDTSDFPTGHALFSTTNKKVIGKFKDETAGVSPSEFVGLKPKMYSLLVDGEAKKTAKGVAKSVVKNTITHEDYRDAVLNKNLMMSSMKQFRSVKHNIYMMQINKVSLNPYDDKRYVLDDGVSTLAHGHYKIKY